MRYELILLSVDIKVWFFISSTNLLINHNIIQYYVAKFGKIQHNNDGKICVLSIIIVEEIVIIDSIVICLLK